MKLKKQLSEIEALIEQEDQLATEVSKAGTYWHLYHMMRVVMGIPQRLHESTPADYVYRFNFSHFYITLRGRIPRGVGKSPKVTTTENPISKAQLHELLEQAKTAVSTLDALPRKAHFKHPYFGVLNKRQSINFMVLHTEHHLKIVREILEVVGK
jgi:hypothetical protein